MRKLLAKQIERARGPDGQVDLDKLTALVAAAYEEAELDRDENPTYRFVDGVAKTSLAHRVAERLGVTPQSLRELILRNNPELMS